METSTMAQPTCAEIPSPSEEVRLTIERIQAGLPKLDGTQKAYAESLIASLRGLRASRFRLLAAFR